ncbi:hypothetical protein DMB92_09070 [Campylobacter sp. MIT 99-7217]|uniref:DUF3310 domain-containing protein n=1 Tax=Campylobacter sp. MIT 99-7217 TaxID=535091 RepID=UPI001157A302|nr:DUF3310 domain-containing protein [Campylobacter sp. MIT 99-7217]TQR28710.1 hypothetical protein DMB92_09070 [Campylobacter sp. MIT 99-7217]
MQDLINNPAHYKGYGFESLELLEKLFKKMHKNINAFYLGNAIKYALRCEFKGNKLQDLQKCEFFVKKLEMFIDDSVKTKNLHESFKPFSSYIEKIRAKNGDIATLVSCLVAFALEPFKNNHAVLKVFIQKLIEEMNGSKG